MAGITTIKQKKMLGADLSTVGTISTKTFFLCWLVNGQHQYENKIFFRVLAYQWPASPAQKKNLGAGRSMASTTSTKKKNKILVAG